MSLPPLDLHAHVDATIAASELTALSAVIFVATRTLDEAQTAVARRDRFAVWGVGCHPANAAAQREFDPIRFGGLIERTCFVSEIGLDGAARVDMDIQRSTLVAVLEAVARRPRVTSLHSYRATGDVLDCLAVTPIRGAVLHWWLGSVDETARAVEMGCFFSVNASSVRKAGALDHLPLERILTETDHPFGDRRNRARARPGAVTDVERAVAKHHSLTATEVRGVVWDNLARLVQETETARLLPRAIRLQLIAR